jgi:hypothetical protein
MNVKYMTHFSTTRDAVIFPEQMQKVERTQEIDGKTGLSVEDVLLTVGMSWPDNPVFNVVSAAGIEYYQLNSTELSRHYLILDNGIVDLYRDQSLVLNDVLRIEKP